MGIRPILVVAVGSAVLAGAPACAPPVGDPCDAFDACPTSELSAGGDEDPARQGAPD